MRHLLLPVALVLGANATLAAQQQAPARIEGVVFDSLRVTPLRGASITVMQVAPVRQLILVSSDSAGHYAADSLPAGRYQVSFATPFLDSLELQLPQRELALSAGERARLDFATPSRSTLATAACPGTSIAKGRGAIVGQVSDADTDAPLPGATIVVRWAEIGVDLKAMRATSTPRTASVESDARGFYRVCNVPSDTYVMLQVQQQGRAGAPLRASVTDAAGVMLQNLSLSPSAAREFSVADTMPAPASDTLVRLLSGNATVTGIVRGPNGQPLVGAQVRVIDALGSARTDSTGHFTLSAQPAGSQMLEVRHVGYLLGQQPVELRANRTVSGDVQLARIVTLDSVRVVAQRTRLQEFERRAGKSSSAGAIIREKQIEEMHVIEASDILRRTLGFSVIGEGLDAKVRSSRGLASLKMECDANVVIDGFQHQDINLVQPGNIAAIEIYRGAAGAPTEYDSACGAVIIWTKR